MRFAIEAVLYNVICLNNVSEAEIAWETELHHSAGREKGKYVRCDYDGGFHPPYFSASFSFWRFLFSKKKAPKRNIKTLIIMILFPGENAIPDPG